MGIRVKTGGAKRWVDRAAIAQESYIEGARNPRKSWAKATAESEQNWKIGVQEASSKGHFAKGVKKAGDATWLKGIEEKGASRFAQGVALAEDKYAAGIAPYLDKLASIDLPPRGPKADPKNLARVAKVMKEMHDLKLKLKG